VKHTPWYDLWKLREKDRFLTSMRIFFPIAAVGYVFHYYLDIQQNKTPLSLWFNFRFSMAGAALLCSVLYFIPRVYNSQYRKIPALLCMFAFCYFQAQATTWHAGVPYLYSFAFVYMAILMSRMILFNSLIYAGV